MADNRTEYAEFLQRILNGDTSFSLLKQSIPAEKRGFFNMLFMTAMRRLTFIKETVLPRFIKKKVPQKQQILECILYLGTTELLFMDSGIRGFKLLRRSGKKTEREIRRQLRQCRFAQYPAQ